VRWPFEDPGHVALRRAIRTTLGTAISVATALWLLPGSPGVVLAAFGVFALLAFADFGGTWGRRFVALISTGIAGVILITVGTLAAGVIWRVVVVTFLITGALAYLVVLRGAFANAAPALTVVFVVTVMVATSTEQLAAMLQGYAVAVFIAIPITLFVFPRRTPARVRAACVIAMRTLAEHERNRLADHPRDVLALDGALQALRSSYLGNPFRSTGFRASDRALMSLVGQLQALLTATRRTAEVPTPVSDLPGNIDYIHTTIACLDSLADALGGDGLGEPSGKALAQAWVGEWDVAVQCLQDSTPSSLETDLRKIAHAFPDRALGISAVRLSILVRRFLNLPAETFDTGTHTVPEPPDYQPWAALRTQFTTKSPWMRTALRTGVALAVAAGVVETLGLAHGFWVLLGVIATLRQDSLGTLRTALLAVGGTFGGALIGAGVLLLFSGDEPVIVVAFLITAFLSVYFQGTAPFALAQGVFSLYVVLVFSIVAWPPDLSTATDRVLDIAIGGGISLATAFLLWPRGVVAGLKANVLDAIDRARLVLQEAFGEFFHGAKYGGQPPDIKQMQAAMARTKEVVEVELGSHDPRQIERAIQWERLIDDLRALAVTGSLVSAWAGDGPALEDVAPALVEPIRDDCAAVVREWELVRSILAGNQGAQVPTFDPIVPRTMEAVGVADLNDRAVADRAVAAIWAHGWLSLTYGAALTARQPAEALA
jgi:uncharacterized membrane protein YccC